MKRFLLVLTRKYPYDFGEPFLESEIEKHKKYYDNILVLSQDVSLNSKQTRIPPEGIQFAHTATGSRVQLRRKDWMNAPKIFLSKDKTIRQEMAERKLNLFQKLFLCYFQSRCVRLLEEAKAILKNVDVSQYDEITIYSYWLFANASVGVDLREYFLQERNFTKKIVLISRAHRYDIYEEENKLKYLPLRNKLLNNVDYIFPCSMDGAEYLCKKYPEASANIRVAYLGTRDYGLSPVSSKQGKFHIVSCSRVVKVKGLERLIDELSLLEPTRKVLWTHIGGGVDGKTDYFEKVKFYAQQKLKNISFEFTGPKENAEVYAYYKENCVDVFVNCSYSEGLPVSLMEASGFGIPVIATDVGGSREILDGEKNGYLLDKNFAKGHLAEIINQMLEESEQEYCARRKAARLLWEQRYCAEVNYKNFARTVAEL